MSTKTTQWNYLQHWYSNALVFFVMERCFGSWILIIPVIHLWYFLVFCQYIRELESHISSTIKDYVKSISSDNQLWNEPTENFLRQPVVNSIFWCASATLLTKQTVVLCHKQKTLRCIGTYSLHNHDMLWWPNYSLPFFILRVSG